MKLRNLAVAAMITAGMAGCLNSNRELRVQSAPAPIEISNTAWAKLDLTVGYVSLSGDIQEITDGVIPVDWAVGIEYAQVIGSVQLDTDQNPDFLRVVFTSDRIEWVGIDGNDYAVYESEEDCLEVGYHCEPVVPGEGLGGVFESTPDNFSAVVNTHCSASFIDYVYRVSAYVIDFSWPNPIRVSNIAEIEIICEQI